ncbi:hypothetical protein [Chishuiella changwenlii]|uniref:hypothetical protein n=1 Tax=Chishuiella changwenlii TaxID=1434701 RepID=UPI002FDA75F3
MVKDVLQFNQSFQLYQKDNRFNLHVQNYPKEDFLRLFYIDQIEDLQIEYSNGKTNSIKKIKEHKAKISDIFEADEIESLNIKSISGYFSVYDFYFINEGDAFIFNYIHRDFLSQLMDILLYELDCNFIGRLKTELLINLEYD